MSVITDYRFAAECDYPFCNERFPKDGFFATEDEARYGSFETGWVSGPDWTTFCKTHASEAPYDPS